MKSLLALMAIFLLAPGAANADRMVGQVVGFKIVNGQDQCYAAIEDPDNKHYSNGYHYIENKDICSIAKAAFMTGAAVIVETRIEGPKAPYGIHSIEMKRTGSAPYWPVGGAYSDQKR